MSPRHCVLVHLKWHFVDFVDAMQIFVDFNHVSLLFYRLGSFNAFNLSQYSWHFSFGISFVALRCTFSSVLWFLLSVGAHITFPYSKIGLTRLEYSFFTVCPSKNVNDLLINPSILLALFAINSTCWSNFSSGSTCTPKSLSFVVSPRVVLVPLLAITIRLAIYTSADSSAFPTEYATFFHRLYHF